MPENPATVGARSDSGTQTCRYRSHDGVCTHIFPMSHLQISRYSELLTKEDFALLVGLGVRTIERLTQQGKLRPIVIHKRNVKYGYGQIVQFYRFEEQKITDLPLIYTFKDFSRKVALSDQCLRKLEKEGIFMPYTDISNRRYYIDRSLENFYDFQHQNIAPNSQVCLPKEAANLLRVSQNTLSNWEKTGELSAYRDLYRRKFYLDTDIMELSSAYASKESYC